MQLAAGKAFRVLTALALPPAGVRKYRNMPHWLHQLMDHDRLQRVYWSTAADSTALRQADTTYQSRE